MYDLSNSLHTNEGPEGITNTVSDEEKRYVVESIELPSSGQFNWQPSPYSDAEIEERARAVVESKIDTYDTERPPVTVIDPAHYRSHPSGVECIEITEHLGFCVGNAIKYLWRAGLKQGTPPADDLRKSIWYIRRELRRLGEED